MSNLVRRFLRLNDMAEMEVDTPVPPKKADGKQRFEVKKVCIALYSRSPLVLIVPQWNAVSLWAWGTLPILELESSTQSCLQTSLSTTVLSAEIISWICVRLL